jgi:hypothetical protein
MGHPKGEAKAPAWPHGRPSLLGAQFFVTTIFVLLACAFLASTWQLFAEFRDTDPWTLAFAHSHLFIFFPTFGLLVLAAFYLPSVIFTHLYWHNIWFGRVRFLIGFAIAIALASWVAGAGRLGDEARPRAVWEVAPQVLTTDRGEPANCGGVSNPCTRGALLPVMQTLRVRAGETLSLSKFGRACKTDPLLELPADQERLRWCFPAARALTAKACCQVQTAYSEAVTQNYLKPSTRSLLSSLDRYLMPFKTFFIIVLLVIGIMLVVWQHRVRDLYPELHHRMERHVFIGAVAMLIWPVMDYAYLDTSNVLFGRPSDALQARLSLVVAPWAMLLLFYYLQRFGKRIEVVGQILTVGATLLAVFARDEIKDWAVRLVGIGMPWWMGVVLGVFWLIGLFLVLAPERWMPPPPDRTQRVLILRRGFH